MDTGSTSTAKGSYSLKVCVKSKKGETKSTHLYTGINSETDTYPAFSRSAVAAVAGIMRGYDFKDYGISIVTDAVDPTDNSPTFSADATTQTAIQDYFENGSVDAALIKFLTYVVSQTYPVLRKASRVANVTNETEDDDPCLIEESGGRFTACVQNCIFELSVTVH
jgi:hypothetical protein